MPGHRRSLRPNGPLRKLVGDIWLASGHNHGEVVRIMRSRRRTSSVGRAVCRLIALAILTLPGGHYRGILPGIEVDNRHRWASVCDKCPGVEGTWEVQQPDVICGKCRTPCRNLPMYYCDKHDSLRILVYESQAQIRRGIECQKTTHVPEPRFTGMQSTGNSRLFNFAPGGSS